MISSASVTCFTNTGATHGAHALLWYVCVPTEETCWMSLHLYIKHSKILLHYPTIMCFHFLAFCSFWPKYLVRLKAMPMFISQPCLHLFLSLCSTAYPSVYLCHSPVICSTSHYHIIFWHSLSFNVFMFNSQYSLHFKIKFQQYSNVLKISCLGRNIIYLSSHTYILLVGSLL